MLDPTETTLMERVGKVTDVKLIVLPSSSSFELQFTTQLINRCELKLKTDVHVLIDPTPILEQLQNFLLLLSAMFLLGFLELHSFCTYCGYDKGNN